VFNLCETFAGNDALEMHVTAVLDLLGVRFTGTGPRGMALRGDKATAKKLLAFHDVPCPDYARFDKDQLEFAGKMRFPMFVKPLHRDASVGIDESSLVNDYASLMERINYIHTQLNDTALVEAYIEGREFYVSILGNHPRQALPLIELDFGRMPDGRPHIYGREAKFEEDSPQFAGTNAIIATDLPPEVRNRILKVGLEAATVLQVEDYARVDIRLSTDGIPYVVEVNANPYLEQTAAFALAALQEGMGYKTLINRIVEIAWQRWELTAPKQDGEPKPARRRSRRDRGGERVDSH
jgi:D-alanine-D-alanine ligase